MYGRGSIGRSALAVLPIAAGTFVQHLAGTASITVAPTGAATRRASGSGAASIVVSPSAAPPTRRVVAGGSASIDINAVANGTRLLVASGLATIAVGLSAVVTYAFQHWAPWLRIVRVSRQDRELAVPSSRRTIIVPHDPDIDVEHDDREMP